MPSSSIYRISGLDGTVAGVISCLATNAFTKKWAKPSFPFFLVTMADFFRTKGNVAKSPSPNVQLRCPGIDGEGRVYDNRCSSHCRVDSICEGYQIRECTAPIYRGRRRGCDNQCMTRCSGKYLESRIQSTQVSREKQKIKGEAKD